MKDESKEPEAIDGAVRVAHLVKHASFFISNCVLSTNNKYFENVICSVSAPCQN